MFRKLGICAAVASTLFTFSSTVSADTIATATMDITGSMNRTRDNGQTRCNFAKEKMIANIEIALDRGVDKLNVKAFSTPGAMYSITRQLFNVDFVNTSSYTSTNSQGRAFVNALRNKINSLSCPGGSTALGDSICLNADELRTQYNRGDTLRMLTITDAGENSSQICGGSNYVTQHIQDKILNEFPMIRFDIAMLTDPDGNVGLRAAGDDTIYEEAELELRSKLGAKVFPKPYPLPYPSPNPAPTQTSSEVQQLTAVATLSGGESLIIEDDDDCRTGCNIGEDDSGDDGDWGGDW
ncbi:hypothetical protein [Pleionea sediminis]|uniref:hypothetical protein n=1 Tax=Pleionea sediminis TaxID=2569479 RepID=UPI001186219F|nr:hypothetical protein [Pleionea sediminis]